jgi:hypothetical protein
MLELQRIYSLVRAATLNRGGLGFGTEEVEGLLLCVVCGSPYEPDTSEPLYLDATKELTSCAPFSLFAVSSALLL